MDIGSHGYTQSSWKQIHIPSMVTKNGIAETLALGRVVSKARLTRSNNVFYRIQSYPPFKIQIRRWRLGMTTTIFLTEPV
jgi:hypothetical protein